MYKVVKLSFMEHTGQKTAVIRDTKSFCPGFLVGRLEKLEALG